MAYGSRIPSEKDAPAERKCRGAFFTPPELVARAVEWAIASPSMRVLEPACGEAAFLLAASQRLERLGAPAGSGPDSLIGVETHSATAEMARTVLGEAGAQGTVILGDFFDLEPGDLGGPFDTVVGNPPYIRYQTFTGAQREKALAIARAEGVRLGARSSSWAPFLIHACRFLNTGGSLAFVLPRELMSANYAADVRGHLLRSFSSIDVDVFDSSVFPEVETGIVLLRASGYALGGAGEVVVRQMRDANALSPGESFVVSAQGQDRWPDSRLSVEGASLLERACAHGFAPLRAWGRVRLGFVTGDNGFFLLTQDEVERLGLESRDLVSTVPPGSASVRSLALTATDLGRLTDQGMPTWLFYPRENPQGGLSDAALAYIREGVAYGVSQRYKCRVRTPWWRVPLGASCDVLVTAMNGAGPCLCANLTNAPCCNSLHGLRVQTPYGQLAKRVLPMVSHTSVFQLSAELYGRAYGGGMLKVEPRDAERLLVIDQETAERVAADPRLGASLGSIKEALAQRDERAARSFANDLLRKIMGLDDGLLEDADRLTDSLRELRVRRSRRGARPMRGSR